MIKDIEFRGRNVIAPLCWIYGYYAEIDDISYIINKDGKFSINVGSRNEYTTVKDNADRKIFEGDIYKAGNKYYVVRWIKDGFYFMDKDGYGDRLEYQYHSIYDFVEQFNKSLIFYGTVWENPELGFKL